jgi:hypothetical protein
MSEIYVTGVCDLCDTIQYCLVIEPGETESYSCELCLHAQKHELVD